MTRPEELISIDGLKYKFGRFGFIYFRAGSGDWHKSTISVDALRSAWRRRFIRLVSGVKAPEVEGSAKKAARLSLHRKTQQELMAPYINSEKWKTMGLVESQIAAQG